MKHEGHAENIVIGSGISAFAAAFALNRAGSEFTVLDIGYDLNSQTEQEIKTLSLTPSVHWPRPLKEKFFPVPKASASGVEKLAIAAVILPAAAWTIHSFISMRGTRPIKVVGENMTAMREPLRIADVSTPFAFHARAEFVWLPDCDEATALQFLNKQQVTHIVVRSNTMEWRPYLKKWMAGGVPDARLTAQVISGTGDTIQVYELRRAGGA